MEDTPARINSKSNKVKNWSFTVELSDALSPVTKIEGIRKPIPEPIMFVTINNAKANDLYMGGQSYVLFFEPSSGNFHRSVEDERLPDRT